MKYQKPNNTTGASYALASPMSGEVVTGYKKTGELRNTFQQYHLPNLDDLLTKLAAPPVKKSFLVFKHNKYITVPVDNIAFFHVKYDSTVIVTFDKQEYFVNYSLEQILHLVSDKQFFRMNRQYLINFNAVKEVEHYFARKLLVNLTVPVQDKLLVPKEKVTNFLQWMENR